MRPKPPVSKKIGLRGSTKNIEETKERTNSGSSQVTPCSYGKLHSAWGGRRVWSVWDIDICSAREAYCWRTCTPMFSRACSA